MFPILRIALVSLLAGYCLVCLVVLESRNRAVAGGVLQQFHHEYADGGSMKWRFGRDPDSDPRRPTYDFIKSFGLFVYPVAIIGIITSAVLFSLKQSRAIALGALTVCSIVLLRFVFLGVLTAALG